MLELFKKGIKDAILEFDRYVATKSAVSFINPALLTKIDIMKKSIGVEAIFNQMVNFSDSMHQMKENYLTNHYQVVVAATMWVECVPKMVSILAAGNGKTYLILMNAKYANTQGIKSIIVLTNEMLQRQMEDYLHVFCNGEEIETALIDEITVD